MTRTMGRAERFRSGIPACWTWPFPPGAAEVSEDMRHLDMAEWQADRCAVCGVRWPQLKRDHDHDSGLVRGYLCSSCNVLEGYQNADIFVRYREINPASIWAVEWEYEGWEA